MTRSLHLAESANETGITSSTSAGDETESLIESLIERSERLMVALRSSDHREAAHAKAPKRWTLTETAAMVSRSTSGIRKAEKEGALPEAPKNPHNNFRVGYTLADINRIRRHFGWEPVRDERDPTVRMAFANFKGGVAKTTLTTHFAQYLAMRGYRTLVVDADSQASSTMMFGFHPDAEVEYGNTLAPYFAGEESSLEYAIRPTHWDGIDLIPASLELYGAEYQLAGVAGDGSNWLGMLDRGIATVEARYDVVLIDPPPALGMISLNVLRALTGLIVPTPPAMLDFHSTMTFFSMLDEVLEAINKNFDEPIRFGFLKMLLSKYDATRPSQEFVAGMIQDVFADAVVDAAFLLSAEINSASSQWSTVYELDKPSGSRATYRRCLESLDAVFGEIEREIQGQWPHRRRRRQQQVVTG